MSNKKKMVSLFSGALGLDIGLKKSGFELCSVVECDSIAVKTAKENLERLNSTATVIEQKMDLDNIDSICKNILKDNNLKKGEVHILAGAPPCQPFSTAGKRQSIMDARGDGFSVFFQAVRSIRPKYFVIENVKGILSAAIKHRPLSKRGSGFPSLKPEEEHGSAFIKILDDLNLISGELGYCISWGILNSANFGSPQSRERLIVIGSIDGQFVWPEETHSKNAENGKKEWVTLRTALSTLKETEPLYRNFNESVSSYLDQIPEGGNWRNLPEKLHENALGGAFHSWGGRSGFLRRLSWNKPSPTITQSPASKATMLCHPVETRPLSVRECARIQQFPDEWVFSGGISVQYKQIGNATPIALAEAIGSEIKKADRRKKGLHNKKMYCADPELLRKIISRPKTMLNPPEHRKVSDPEKTKAWLKQSMSGRKEFRKYLAFGA